MKWRMLSVPEGLFVLAMAGLLLGAAVPGYSVAAAERVRHKQQAVDIITKQALIVAKTDHRGKPSLTELANYFQADQVVAADSSITLDLLGDRFKLKIYRDGQCTSATTSVADVVGCIGHSEWLAVAEK